MSAESSAMDCAESSVNQVEVVPEALVEEEKKAGSPAVGAKSADSTVPAEIEGKVAEDVEMQDLTLEDLAPSGPTEAAASVTEKPKEEAKEVEEIKEGGKDAKEATESISIDIASSPVPEDEPQDAEKDSDKPPLEVDSDSSVELIESPVKSPSSNESAGDQPKSDDVDAGTEPKAKEAEDLADSSIELISSPTSESSPEKDGETKEQGDQKENQEEQEPKEKTDAPIMEVDQEVPIKPTTYQSGDTAGEDESKKSTPMEIEPQSSALKKDDILEVELEKATAPKAPEEELLNELPSDGDIFYGKDCVNCNCQKLHKQFVLTSMGTLNFYKVQRKRSKQQFLCMGCHDTAMDLYEVK